jgi:hypothetical protein
MMKSDPDHGTSETLGVAPARPERGGIIVHAFFDDAKAVYLASQ